MRILGHHRKAPVLQVIKSAHDWSLIGLAQPISGVSGGKPERTVVLAVFDHGQFDEKAPGNWVKAAIGF